MEEITSGLEHVRTESGRCGPQVRGEDGWFIQPLLVRRVPSRDWDRFVNNVKAAVRRSPEYRRFVGLCKSERGMTRCAFQPGVEDDKADVEIHHAILGLHDVVELVADHMSASSGISTLLVANEVMRAHFAWMVPVVPVGETVHEAIHAGKLCVHVKQVHGDVVSLLKTYYGGIQAEHILKIKRAISESGGDLHAPDLFRIASPEEMTTNPKATLESLERAYLGNAIADRSGVVEKGDEKPPWD